ncbi:helix-turn-helix domain-containing protein [Roseovarius mucosus]|uniref:helix-turn-helix domain-containing protein n=1 Tax=Roseovarius mucosus TaxID=215743 RepID=UPI003F702397
MSLRAINWAFSVIPQHDLRPAATLTLLALAHCHNQETGRCDPSAKLICEKTSLSERAVRDGLRQLESAKLIATYHRTIRTGRGQRNLRNRYVLKGGANFAGGVGQDLPPNMEVKAPAAFFDLAMSVGTDADEVF